MASQKRHILYTWLVILSGFWILFKYFGDLNLDFCKEYLIMVALGVLAQWLAVSFPYGQLSGGFSVVLSSYLIYGPAAAAWISALATLFGQGIVNRGNPLRTIFFNAGQCILALTVSDYFHFKAAGLNDLLSISVFIIIYFITNHVLVYLYLTKKREYRVNWLDTFCWDGITYLFSTPFGVLMKLLYDEIGIKGSVFLFIPILVIQFMLRLYIHMKLAYKELNALFQIAKKLKEKISIEEILRLVLEEARRVVSYRTGIIYLWSEDKKCYNACVVQGNYQEELQRSYLIKGEGFASWVIENGQVQIIYDTRKEPKLKNEPGLPQVYRSLLFIPLLTEKETLGLFVIGEKRPFAFEEKHLYILEAIVAQVSLAVANAIFLRRLEDSFNTDVLTGVYNHNFFYRQINLEFKNATEQKQPLGLIILDIDSFKSINDYFNYQLANQVLIELAQLIKSMVDKSGFLARYGGDEFVIILPGQGEKECIDLAEKIRQAICEHSFRVDGLSRQVRVSLGVAVYPKHALDVEELIKKANQTLFLAKKMGKNKVVSASRLEI